MVSVSKSLAGSGSELNRQPTDYESVALPNELPCMLASHPKLLSVGVRPHPLSGRLLDLKSNRFPDDLHVCDQFNRISLEQD